jgi:hypothetical protein
LGSGASAHVYLARASDGRDVALKLRGRGDPDQDRRFLREFESLRRLALPGIVTVHDAGHTRDWLYYTMEVVDGEPMRAWVQSKGGTAERVKAACEVGVSLCKTLAAIHQAGFVHRDLKPSNVLVTRQGHVRVLDFGVVRWWAVDEEITGTGGMVGTIPFMAPEQVVGLPLNSAADMFAVGLLLYEGIAGRRASAGSTHGWIARQILHRLKPLCCLDIEIPAALSSAVESCLELEARDRPTAPQLGRVLQQVLEGKGAADWPTPHLFVGRSLEMDPLMRAMAGHGAKAVVIRGAAGAGRRRLLEHARRQALLTGRRVEQGTCRAHVPGSCVGELISRILVSSPKENWRRYLTDIQVRALLEMWPSLPLEGLAQGTTPATRSDVVKAVVALLKATAGARALVLTILQLEQLDSLSGRVLESLVLDSAIPVSILTVLDDRWITPVARDFLVRLEALAQLRILDLPPLDDDDASMVASCLLPAGHELRVSAGRPGDIIPLGLRRLAELSGREFMPLGAEMGMLAMANGPIPTRVAAWCIGDPAPWIQGGLLAEGSDGRLRFSGPAIARAAEITVVDRATAHMRLAEAWVEKARGEQRWVEVARHRVASGAEETTLWQAAARAAVAAERLGRYTTARNCLLMLDDLPKDRTSGAYRKLSFPLAWTRAHIAHMCDTQRLRRDLVEQAAARATDPLDKHRVALLLSQLQQRQGDVKASLAQALRSADAVGDRDPFLASRLCVAVAQARLELGEDQAALETCERGALRVDPKQEPLQAMEMSMLLAQCLERRGKLTAAVDCARRGLAMSRRLDLPRGTGTFALVLARCNRVRGNRRIAEALAWESLTQFAEHGDQYLHAQSALEMARQALERGDLAAAGIHLEHARYAANRLCRRPLQGQALALELELATLGDDTEREQEALSAISIHPCREPDMAVALARRARIRADGTAFDLVLKEAPSEGYAGAVIRLEFARFHLDAGRPALARRPLKEGLGLAMEFKLSELHLYGRLLAGLIPPVQKKGWSKLVDRCLREPWLELFLGAVEFDGRRKRITGDLRGSRARFASLQMRAEDLGLVATAALAARLEE